MEMRLERIGMLTLMMLLSPRPFRRKRQRREKWAVAAKAPEPVVVPIKPAPRVPTAQERALLESRMNFAPFNINVRD